MSRSPRRKWSLSPVLIVTLIIVALFSIPTSSQRPRPEPSTTPQAPIVEIGTQQPGDRIRPIQPTVEPVIPTEVPTEVEPTTVPDSGEPTVIPPTNVPDVPTEEPTVASEIEPTATLQPEGNRVQPGFEDPQLLETYCQMNITDAGDNDPFTYTFTASNSNHIASYAWDFDFNVNPGTDATTQTANYTYPATGSFSVQLTCTPNAGFGSPFTLTGVINISVAVSASFYFSNGHEFEGLPPFTVPAINTSTGGGTLSYAWRISGSSDPLAPGLYNFTTQNVSPIISAADFISAGFPATGPAVLWYHLTATDTAAGLSATASQSVSFIPPAPSVDFTMSPTDGEYDGVTPLVVSYAAVVDPLAGPVDTINWTFQNGTPATATGAGPHNVSYTTVGVWNTTMTYSGPGGGGSAMRQVGVYAPGEPVDAQFSVQVIGGPAGAIEVCFTNESTGPWVQAEWDWESDGDATTYDVINNASVVCQTFTTTGLQTVQLRVRSQQHVDTGTGSSSSATRQFSLTAAPIADFTFTPASPVTQGTQVDFTDTSDLTGGGPVSSWAWDFNGDGITDSTDENPQNIPFNTIGGNVIRLTVTGPGGTSYVEKIIVVTRLEIGCSISGTFNVIPTAGAQLYTANITDQNGRPITYSWTVTGNGVGLPITGSASTLSVDWSAIGYGAFQITLIATTPDGSVCQTTQTVNRMWRAADCIINNPLPGTLYPNGNDYVFTATVNNLDGRAIIGYEWYLNGVLQAATGNTFTYENTDASATALTNMSVRYVAIFNNNTPPTSGYVPATSNCEATRNFTLNPWPTLVCSAFTGSITPIPLHPDSGAQLTENYSVTITGAAGRTVQYTWTVTGGVITSPNPRTNNGNATVQWNPASAEEVPATANDELSVLVEIVNPDGVVVNCTEGRTIGGGDPIAVQYNNLECAVSGDHFVVVGETANHPVVLTNSYGRPITSVVWTLEVESAPGSGFWSPVTGWTDTDSVFSAYTFMTPGASYRLSYVVTVGAGSLPAGDTCTSGYFNIDVYGTGVSFECESVAISGNANPNALGNYTYELEVDNSTGLLLRYVWTLFDSDGDDYELANYTSGTDATISRTFSLADLGPIGPGLYTLRVDVTDSSGTTSHTCFRQINLTVGAITASYTQTVAGGWTYNQMPVNTEICITNTSVEIPAVDTDHPLVYQWTISGTAGQNSLGVTTFTTENPDDCFSFNTPGSYIITLVVRNSAGTIVSLPFSRTFNVYGLQAIVINRVMPIDDFSLSQSFTSVGTNITAGTYQWEFRRVSDNALITTRNQQNPSNVVFPAPGIYRATVTGTGNLGNTSASLEFEILAANSLQARFTPSQWAGVVPLTVCFTDGSVSGTPILSWEWDLDGNGTYETTDQVPPCMTYTTPGQMITISLRVTNAALNDVATNTIQTYTPAEASQNFSITPMGGGMFCFTPLLTNSTLVSWNYGDGTPTTGPLNPACHTYGSSGTFLVTMCFTSNIDGTPGCISRPVTVTSGPIPVPNLVGNVSCDAGTAVFQITNTGDGMTTPDQVTITNGDGSIVLIAPLQLGAGGSTVYTVNNVSGTVVLRTTDITLSVNVLCVEYTVTAVCDSVTFLPVFTVTMDPAGAEDATQNYTINPGGFTGSWTILASDASGTTTVTLPGGSNPYQSYTFTSNGVFENLTVDSNPCSTPQIVVTSVCRTNALTGQAEVGFTITNNGGAMVIAQSFTITPGTYANPGSFQLAGGASVDVLLPTTDDPYALYTLSTAGYAVTTDTDTDCANPDINALGFCRTNGLTGQAEVGFTITNTGGVMLEAQDYTVTGGAATITDSINLPAGGSVDIIVPTTDDPYATYTLNTTGFAGDITAETQTCQRPVLEVTGTCSSPRAITVTNTGGDMLEPENYTVLRDGVSVETGTLQLTAGNSIIIPVTTGTPYGALVFESGENVTVIAHSIECDNPVLTATNTCAFPVVITITNAGADTLEDEPWEIRDSTGTVVASGTNSWTAGATLDIPLTGLDPYEDYVFTSSGFAAPFNVDNTTTCNEPALSVETVCNGTPTFTLTNNGGDMLVPQDVLITSGVTVLVSTNVQLTNGASETFIVSGGNPYLPYVLTTSGGFAAELEASSLCTQPEFIGEGICGTPSGFVIANIGEPMSIAHGWRILSNEDNSVVSSGSFQLDVQESLAINIPDGVDMEVGVTLVTDDFGVSLTLPLTCEPGTTSRTPRVTSVFTGLPQSGIGINAPSCGRSCPVFKLYHTDEIGAWEIYRLDGADQQTRTNVRANLSHGLDENVISQSPSLSPDNRWVIFSSNRDGNWELYVAPTEGGTPESVQRVTFNTVAIDSDPVWGPNNIVVFETTRHGNWDLYAIDMETGQEFRLTNDEGNDINPYWSPDGSRLVFQSDRPDENGDRKWQVYELTLSTLSLTKLSDGTAIDVEPEYGNTGSHIAFRSYAQDGDNSTLWLMNSNGTNRQMFSDAAGDATNVAWSPSDRYIAYQSNLDGDLDIYVYEVGTGETRHLTDNAIPDYAPTWLCDDTRVVWTSDIAGDPNIFEVDVTPISDGPLLVEEFADQLTFEPSNDIYPLSSPSEENASREGNTVRGEFGTQTVFLSPEASLTPIDLSNEGISRPLWKPINVCAGGNS